MDAFSDGVRSKELPRLSDFGVRVLLDLGVFLDEETLRVDGGGMVLTSIPLLPKALFALGVRSGVGSGVEVFFVGEANILARVESCCGTFSLLSSYRS